MTSLTDRYVAATLRGIPSKQRADLERELRASIADAMEDQSELDALRALGDPSRLASSYSDRPLQLIGPAIYLDYRRTLAILLSSVVPLIFLAVSLAAFRDDAGFAESMGRAASASLLVAMHIVVWTTVLFAIVERVPAMRGRGIGAWDPSSLPELPAKRVDRGSLIGGSLVSALIAAVLIVVQTAGPVRDATGDPIGLITPALWNSGALLVVVVFAAVSIAFSVVGYYVGWGIPQALSNLVLSVMFVVVVVGSVRSGSLLNPEFFDAIDWPSGAGENGVVGWIIVVVVGLLSLGNAVDGFARARAGRRP